MPEARQQKFRTFRFLAEDREMVQQIAKKSGYRDRYTALLAVAKLIKELPPPTKKTKRDSLRVGIPDELQKAIEERTGTTGETFTDVLLAGVRELLSRTNSAASPPSAGPRDC